MLQNFDGSTKAGSCASIPTKERFNEEYESEMKMNEEFHRFVANYQLAYQGPNTAHAQIGAKYSTCKLLYYCHVMS